MRQSNGGLILLGVLGFCLGAVSPAAAGGEAPAGARREAAQQTAGKGLSVDRIYSEPSLSGHPTPGIAWAPDGKHLSFFKELAAVSGKELKRELWLMDASSGESRLLVSAEKLETVLPAESENATQATGLGRHAPAQ